MCFQPCQIGHFKLVYLSYIDCASIKLLKYPGVLDNNASLHIQWLNEKLHFDLPPTFFLAVPPSLWNLSSMTRDQTHAPAVELRSLKPLDSQGSPSPFLDLYSNCVHPRSILFWSWWGYLRDATCSLVSLLSTQTLVFLTVNIEMNLDCQRIQPGWWARQGGMEMPIIFHKQLYSIS